MKNSLFFLAFSLCASLAFSQQTDDPVYVKCRGDLVCEFSNIGSTHQTIMPYVKNGKLYFISFALTSQAGPLKHGFEFDLSDRYNPKILGKYIGDKTDYVNLEVPVFVAGFAESKKINITHIFFDLVSANKWAETVKTAQ